MNLFEALHVQPGITAIIGSGGKTSLLARLAGEAPGTVVLATTTHMYPLRDVPLAIGDEQAVCEARAESRVICAGTVAKQGKITAPDVPLQRLCELFDFVFVEADGSKQLPLKAHADWEPVVPAQACLTVLVVGATGFGVPVSQSVHRPELFCERAGCVPEELATPRMTWRVIQAERALGLIAPDAILVNGTAAYGPHRASAKPVFPSADLPIVSCRLARPCQEPLPFLD